MRYASVERQTWKSARAKFDANREAARSGERGFHPNATKAEVLCDVCHGACGFGGCGCPCHAVQL